MREDRVAFPRRLPHRIGHLTNFVTYRVACQAMSGSFRRRARSTRRYASRLAHDDPPEPLRPRQPPCCLRSTSVKRPPSDFELLKAIYERHRADFDASRVTTSTGVFLPIDIPAIATDLGTDSDTVAGRLRHHLDQVYSEHRRDDGKARISFFSPQLGTAANCVNFPLLEAVLAGLWQERDRQLWATWAAAISIAVALAALIVSITTA
jgi:hypothetical protein